MSELTRLVAEQRKHRGTIKSKDLLGKPCRIIGPYHPTPESEARADRILTLRREANK